MYCNVAENTAGWTYWVWYWDYWLGYYYDWVIFCCCLV